MSDIYQKLAEHLDRLPGGFPSTDSGVELKILKKLFTKEQATIATALTLKPETAEIISSRVTCKIDDVKSKLDKMALNGLIFKVEKNIPLYMAAQFVIGIWEYHVNDLDLELVQYFNAYIPYLTKQWAYQKTKQLRVIPIAKSLNSHARIMPYDVAENIIRAQSKIVVANCICRKEHRMAGKGCDNPLEVCLVFGSGAFYYEKNGLGRSIEQNEALRILAKGVDAGMILQPGNAKKAMNICMCCGCCCQILKNLKALPNPAANVHSNYFAVVDSNSCTGCGECIEHCHMDAITLEAQANIDLNRCIGCGICVLACQTKSLSLVEKPDEQRWNAPETIFKTYSKISKERGLT